MYGSRMRQLRYSRINVHPMPSSHMIETTCIVQPSNGRFMHDMIVYEPRKLSLPSVQVSSITCFCVPCHRQTVLQRLGPKVVFFFSGYHY